MYISHISLRNLRCFRHTDCTFRHPDAGDSVGEGSNNVNLIVGGNGAGKTTLLKAIALAVLTPILRDCGYVSHRMVREGMGLARIKGSLMLHEAEADTPFLSWPTSLEIKRLKGKTARETLDTKTGENYLAAYREDNHPSFFLAGYGATRRIETGEYNLGAIRRKRWLRYHRVVTLFEDNEALTPLESWLPQYRSTKRFDEILTLINNLLPDGTTLLDEDQGGDFLFKHNGITLPLSTLSDGYRAYIAWTTDLVAHMAACAPDGMPLATMRGVVLVDEVDLHLHPAWQLQIVTHLSKTLPNLQFIFTSHSPIVAGTFHNPPLVIEAEEDGAMAVHERGETIHGFNVEQILHSPYFGLRTTRAPSKERELVELLRDAQAGDLNAARRYMARANETTSLQEPQS
ncbi:AAA family ATPase [Sulfidibacter corallicola]|uniref:AAA family ATPase n=1 Tax=Sulfidibacter corallicola TaxID=2818388 RepID=A0A8A4THD1_SULCO|nr:AAA family ATPase [Sulfidibacter corallicola]QTD49336.1 AAA family ATPase [Sulfidibacter corallicola]